MEFREEFYTRYEAYLKSRYHPATARIYFNSVEYLKIHLARENREELKPEDLKDLERFFMEHEYEPGRVFSVASAANHLTAVKRFYRWLQSEGRIRTNPLENYFESEFRERMTATRKREREEGLKSRKYSHEEILRKYRKNVYKLYRFEGDMRGHLNSLNRFLKYLGCRNKSMYEAGEEDLKSFVEGLESREYFPGRYYTKNTVLRYLQDIRNFFKWLFHEGHLPENPIGIRFYKERIKAVKESREWRISRIIREDFKEPFKSLMERIENNEQTRDFSEATRKRHLKYYRIFFKYLSENIKGPEEMTQRDIENFIRSLQRMKAGEKPVSLIERQRVQLAVRNLLKQLYRWKIIKEDLSEEVERPKICRGLSHAYMNPRELQIMMNIPDLKTGNGFRTRTIMEVLYSTGMRVNELSRLKLKDINWSEGLIRVEYPKGGKSRQRIVAIGRIALEFLMRYKREIRSLYAGAGEEYVFITQKGTRLQKEKISEMIRACRIKAGLKKNVTAHSFRVSCATDMLKNRADIRHVQEQLGHKQITSTQIYTRLVPADLKKVHKRTHPRERKSFEEITKI